MNSLKVNKHFTLDLLGLLNILKLLFYCHIFLKKLMMDMMFEYSMK